MNFYITDDDESVRMMLTQIIEDNDLGEVVGEAEDGAFLDGTVLSMKNIDILFIDLLMPIQDGIETVRQIKPNFTGKIIMLSQIETKEMIGEAYSLGIEYYITKPINKLEVLAVIQKVSERMRLERSVQDIQKSLANVLNINSSYKPHLPVIEGKIRSSGQFLLSELGIAGKNGSKDLLDIIEYLDEDERFDTLEKSFPPLKEIFTNLAQKKLGHDAPLSELNKEIKACEQRVRRAINHSLNHLASIGLADFSNLKFENYASKFFDFTAVRQKMTELQKENGTSKPALHARINAKKFIQVFYFEAKRGMGVH